MMGSITGFISGGMTSNQCFVAGTLIATANGWIPIEDIQPGNFVWATNPETGETELKPVVQLFRNETDEWVHVTVNGEEIVCTSEHPFYSPVKGWTAACQLRAGDILVLVNGEYVVVEQVQHELLESPVATYNFEVQDFHTYYVGESAVLVHNLCGTQKHHVMTNKNKKYTSQFKEIANKYDLNLSSNANVRTVSNHIGRHTANYHDFVLQKVKSFDVVAAGNKQQFMRYFNKLADYIVGHPGIMYK